MFVGGCTLEAAERLQPQVVDLGIDLFEGRHPWWTRIGQRVDRSQTEPRFAILETISRICPRMPH